MQRKERKVALAELLRFEERLDRQKKSMVISRLLLHTDLHEVIGHASGVINDGIGTPKETLKKNYASTLEEGSCDLVHLYYLLMQKLIEMDCRF